jgi:hypothetical protein
LTTESSDHSLRQPQISAAHPSTKDIPQQADSINRAQALPSITSLQSELSNVQPHQNLPSLPTQRVNTQSDNLTHHHAFAGAMGPGTLQTLEEHQRLGLQMQQQQEEQQQEERQQEEQQQEERQQEEQQQDFFGEDVENEWVVDDFSTYLLF